VRFKTTGSSGRVAIATAGLALIGATAAVGQEAGAAPDGWLARTDRGGHGGGEAGEFRDMPPGFHITTGASGIFYHPDKTASGGYRVESEIFLFDPGQRNEGFGIFIGGADLDGEGVAYTYFLIRRDGSTLVKRREGEATSELQGWTRSDAVVKWEDGEEGAATAGNVLAIEAGPSELVFSVNDHEVFRTARTSALSDGVVGVRVNHGLNVHVSSLEVTSR